LSFFNTKVQWDKGSKEKKGKKPFTLPFLFFL
jgi:hypothetical protein